MLLVGEIKKRGIESMALFGDLDFNSFVDWFATAGGFDVLLPFLLVFTIVFAILEKTNILGEDKKNFNVIIALVIGALLVSQTALVEIINLFIPRVSLFIVIGLMSSLFRTSATAAEIFSPFLIRTFDSLMLNFPLSIII